jgi:hypothetical protein
MVEVVVAASGEQCANGAEQSQRAEWSLAEVTENLTKLKHEQQPFLF